MTMSAHFAVLREAKLVEAEENGTTITYGLKLSVLEDALSSLAEAFGLDIKLDEESDIAGWAFVLAGLGYAIVWLILPVDRANAVAMSIVATTLLLVVGRTAWVVLTRKPALPSAVLWR